MADLFYYTDKDGDSLRVYGCGDLDGRPTVFVIDGQPVGVFVDRDGALRLADALLSYYGLDAPDDLLVEGQQVLIEEEERATP